MFTFGSQVNPSLLRQDFSPILQAAQAQAQATQQAAAIRAQSLAQFGSTVAKGIETYAKKEEEKKVTAEGIDFIKSQFPGISDKEAQAGLKAAGGPAAYVKFRRDEVASADAARLRKAQLDELDRQTAGREILNRALSASPAQRAISAGASFESLPTGVGAFLPQGPRNTAEFISRAQSSGAPADLWLPQAIQYSQIEENVAKAGPKPELGFATPEEALKKASELATGRAGVTPSFNVVQGRYFPIFREQEPGAYERETDKLAAQAAQKRLDQFTSDYDNAIAAGTSATMVLEGLDAGKTTGVFQPLVNLFNRLGEAAGIKDLGVVKDELMAKGIAGQQASQVSLLARGLGSVSNADREFYVATTPSITDSTLANRYFAEMAKENEKFAKQDRALIRQMQDKKVPTQEIVNSIEALRESRNVARDVYRRVIGGEASPNASKYLR